MRSHPRGSQHCDVVAQLFHVLCPLPVLEQSRLGWTHGYCSGDWHIQSHGTGQSVLPVEAGFCKLDNKAMTIYKIQIIFTQLLLYSLHRYYLNASEKQWWISLHGTSGRREKVWFSEESFGTPNPATYFKENRALWALHTDAQSFPGRRAGETTCPKCL